MLTSNSTVNHCGHYTEMFEVLKRQISVLNGDYNQFIIRGIPPELDKLHTVAKALQDSIANIKTNFKEDAVKYFKKWLEDKLKDNFDPSIFSFDEFGRVTVELESGLSVGTFVIGNDIDYFPAMIKDVRGNLNLGKNIREAKGLVKVYDVNCWSQNFTATDLEIIDIQLNAPNAQTLILPRLKRIIQGSLYAPFAQNLSINNLEYVGEDITINEYQGVLNLPHLTASGEIGANRSSKIILPEITECGGIFSWVAEELEIPKLPVVKGNLYLPTTSSIKAEMLSEIEGTLTLLNLPEEITFREAFPQLRKVNTSLKGKSSITINSVKRLDEIHDLALNGKLEIHNPVRVV